MKLNNNVDERDVILFGEKYNKDRYFGGCRRFDDITLEVLETLVEKNFIDLDECQNDSPTTEEFLEYMKDHEQFVAFGYAISPDRGDYRITLEGIRSDVCFDDIDEMIDFTNRFRYADEFDVKPPYAWWD